jgi:hypothetical protein
MSQPSPDRPRRRLLPHEPEPHHSARNPDARTSVTAQDDVVKAADQRFRHGLRRQIGELERLLDNHDLALAPLRDLAPGLVGYLDDAELADRW